MSVELSARDLALADAVADRVFERIAAMLVPALEPTVFVDAAELARQLGTSRSAVYANADRLGGRRIGGPRGRLRFPPAARLPATPTTPPTPAPRPPAHRRRSPSSDVPLLPIRGRAPLH